MNPPPRHPDDWHLVQRYLAGDDTALATVVERLTSYLKKWLIQRGAQPDQAEDLVAGLWTDCLRDQTNRPSLLEKYNGQSALQSWLAIIAVRRLIDLRRRPSIVIYTAEDPRQEAAQTGLELRETATMAEPVEDDQLTQLLATALRRAFDRRTATELFLLRLVHLHGLTQREAGQLLGRNESAISRMLHKAMKAIAEETLAHVRAQDPVLDLTWDDFVDLCQTQYLSFL